MKSKICTVLFWSMLSVFLGIATIIRALSDWFDLRFGVSFEEVLFTITSPLEGSDISFMDEAIEYIVPEVLSTISSWLIVVPIIVLLKVLLIRIHLGVGKKTWKIDIYQLFKVVCVVFVAISIINSIKYGFEILGLEEYIARKTDKTTIYEEYYVDPKEVSVKANGEPKNLIYIYLESMETTYASVDDGGYHEVNYIPKLTQLSRENISFSDSEKMGGAKLTSGATWTMGALFSTTTGVPFSVPVGGNNMSDFELFTPGVTSLGDLLNEKGYKQMFLCGSDGSFGGRQNYFEQHGNYNVVDYFDAIEKNYIDENYRVWWGYEDLKLYDIAKTELLELAQGDEPFNFTMLTVDTHHVDGYVCENCKDTYSNQLGNVLECADNQIYEFINWCKEQDFYEDTVIIITGDHFRMDSSLIPEGAERRLYNCFINSAVEPESAVQNRDYTSLDLFPTTLAAMGFEIEGNRLGLGTNLFSREKTLTEQIGFETLDIEVSKYSEFYENNFQ